MRVWWDLPPLGRVHKEVPDDEVMAFCESIIKLGFTPEVTKE